MLHLAASCFRLKLPGLAGRDGRHNLLLVRRVRQEEGRERLGLHVQENGEEDFVEVINEEAEDIPGKQHRDGKKLMEIAVFLDVTAFKR